MQSTATIITALYNIVDINFGPQIDINVPMIIYTTPALQYKIWYHRSNKHQTTVHVTRPTYFTTVPNYRVNLLKDAVQTNIYNTSYLVWIDISNFAQDKNLKFNPSYIWPDPYKLIFLNDIPCDAHITIQDTHHSLTNLNEHILRIAGHPNMPQTPITIQYNTNEYDGQLWMKLGFKHIYSIKNIDLSTLARGYNVGLNYFVDTRVGLLTFKPSISGEYKNWLNTVQQYAYEYHIIEQDIITMNQDFRTRLQLYYEYLKTSTQELTTIMDCTCTIITASSTELYDKFMKMGHNIVIGAESHMHSLSNISNQKWISYFEEHSIYDQKYPNIGFIMGYTKKLKQIFDYVLQSTNPELEFCELIQQGTLHMDYETQLIGTLLDYREYDTKSENYYEYDTYIARYKTRCNNHTPIFFSFPGCQKSIIHKFQEIIHPTSTLSSTTEVPISGFIVWIIMIIVIIVIILI